jgi:hypothetical protein
MGGSCSVGKPQGKRPLIKPKHRWNVKIKMDLQEIGWEVCTGLIWLRTDRWQSPGNAVINIKIL